MDMAMPFDEYYDLYLGERRRSVIMKIIKRDFCFDGDVLDLIHKHDDGKVSDDEFLYYGYKVVYERYVSKAVNFLFECKRLSKSMLSIGFFPGCSINNPSRFYFLLFVNYFIHAYIGAKVLDRELNKMKPASVVNEECNRELGFWIQSLRRKALYEKEHRADVKVDFEKNNTQILRGLRYDLRDCSADLEACVFDCFEKLKYDSMSFACDVGALADPQLRWNLYACKFIGYEAISACLYNSDYNETIKSYAHIYLYGHGKRLVDANPKSLKIKRSEYLMEGLPSKLESIENGRIDDYKALKEIFDSESCSLPDLAVFSKVLSMLRCKDEEKNIKSNCDREAFLSDISIVLDRGEGCQVVDVIKGQLIRYIKIINNRGVSYVFSSGSLRKDPASDARYWYWGSGFCSEIHDLICGYGEDTKKNMRTIFLMYYKHEFKAFSETRAKTEVIVDLIYNAKSIIPKISDIIDFCGAVPGLYENVLVSNEWSKLCSIKLGEDWK